MGYTSVAMSTNTPSRSLKALARPPRELVASPGFLLKRLGLRLKERSSTAFEASGETPYCHGVLALLAEGDRETQATIADALGWDRSYLVGLLDDLEQRGYIERRRDKADRRRHVVSITPEGKKALARMRTLSSQVEGEFLAPLDDEERETLHRLLLKVAVHHDARLGADSDV
jgi:DNA-binding MarR family transcriptional regulator